MTEKELAKKIVNKLGYGYIMKVTGLSYTGVNSWTQRRIPKGWYDNLKLRKPKEFKEIENEA